MLPKAPLQVLSHPETKSPLGEVIGTYERTPQEVDQGYTQAIEQCQVFYWTSYPQYLAYKEKFKLSQDAIHCAGAGKTYASFCQNNVPCLLFFGMRDFQQWINDNE